MDVNDLFILISPFIFIGLGVIAFYYLHKINRILNRWEIDALKCIPVSIIILYIWIGFFNPDIILARYALRFIIVFILGDLIYVARSFLKTLRPLWKGEKKVMMINLGMLVMSETLQEILRIVIGTLLGFLSSWGIEYYKKRKSPYQKGNETVQTIVDGAEKIVRGSGNLIDLLEERLVEERNHFENEIKKCKEESEKKMLEMSKEIAELRKNMESNRSGKQDKSNP